jgi:DNA-binding NarL/FixJ family response regulator
VAKRPDWISVIEASYGLDCTDQVWLDNVFDHAKPLLDRGIDCAAYTYRCTPTSFRLENLTTRASHLLRLTVRLAHTLAPPQWFDLVYRSGNTVGTASEKIYPYISNKLFLELVGGRSRDVFMTGGSSGTSLGVALGVLLRDKRRPSAMERKRWPQIAAHLGAGLRLRTVARQLSLDSERVDAVLDADGSCRDARNDATTSSARDRLREATRRIDRARTAAGRSEPDTAMDHWQGLVDGRWSLVDKFDSDGRRFVVAIKNDPVFPDPRGLSPRERQIAEFVGAGHTTKQIAYLLGISLSAVTNCTAHAQQKLGLSSLCELAHFFAPAGLRRKLAEVAVAGEKLLVGAYPLVDQRRIASLTPAEQAIVVDLVSGSTNFDIAQRRGSSERTVANQVQSIFQKLGTRSRADLAASLQASTSR